MSVLLRNVFFIVAIGSLLAISFLYGQKHHMHQIWPSPINRHITSGATAISHLKTGLSGYQIYYDIYKSFEPYKQIIIKDPELKNDLSVHVDMLNGIFK